MEMGGRQQVRFGAGRSSLTVLERTVGCLASSQDHPVFGEMEPFSLPLLPALASLQVKGGRSVFQFCFLQS